MARRRPDKTPLATRKPFPGTSYWPCPTDDCRGPDGERSRWPLRVYLGRGKKRVGKTAVCPRCGCRRSMTGDEAALYDEALPGVEAEIRAAVNSRGKLIDPHAIWSRGLMAASDAAMAYDPRMGASGLPANGLIVQRVCRAIRTANTPNRDLRLVIHHEDGLGEHIHAPGDDDGPEAIDLDELFLQADVNDRDREFLSLRFGLSGEPAMTVDQVAAHFRLPRSRAVEWQAELFERMRKRCKFSD